jgi:hypothetical protein
MSIHVEEELSQPTVTGKIGGMRLTNTNCQSTFTVGVKTTSSVVVTWFGELALFVVEGSGGDSVSNGETIDELTEYNLSIDGYRSYNDYQNNNDRTVTFFIHDNFGNLIHSKSFNRRCSSNYC